MVHEPDEFDFDWCRIEHWESNHSTRIVFYDGLATALMVAPIHDTAHCAKAMRLGYSGDESGIAAMLKDRYLLHTRLAIQMGLPWSPTLYSEALLAQGVSADDCRITSCEERVREEQYVLSEQKRLNKL